MVVTDLEGRVLEGRWRPSVDLPHHLYLYRHRPEIGGVIHTHSNYATSFAALGRPIPAYLTAIADEFGDEIPCAPYVDNQGDNIGQAILKHIGTSPAILLAHHGAFAIGKSPRDALKAAVMLEDVARTCHLALAKGDPRALPPEEIAKWYDRYHTSYGQPETTKKRPTKGRPPR
jgi:L-ribulose-5-phosphate 4-epimerase